MARWCALAAAYCLMVAAAPPTAREQIAAGLIQGFVSDRSDLNDCVGGTDGILTGADAALEEILKGNLHQKAEGLRKLYDSLESIPAVMTACKASRVDVIAMRDALKQVKGVKGLLSRIASDISSDGARIGNDIVGSVAAFKAADYVDCGRRLGAALRRVLVAERPMPPLPRPEPPYNRFMRERAPAQMVRAEPEDHVEVYWNLSPLYEELLNSSGGALGLFHCSVGFVNLRTQLNSTFEFAADHFDGMLLFPELNFTDRSMVWKNTGKFKAKEGELDFDYWQFRTRVAVINGATYNEFLLWSQTAVDQFTHYSFFNFVVPGHDRHQLQSFTCFDAGEAMLLSISKLAGPCVFDSHLPGVVRNDINAWGASEAVPLDSTSAEVAFKFYAAISQLPDLKSKSWKKIVAEIIRLTSEFKGGQSIFHDSNGRYWSYKAVRPIISIKTVVAPLPAGCQTILI